MDKQGCYKRGFVIHLIPEPAGRDSLGRLPVIRLRAFLKRSLRSYGLRAKSVQPALVDMSPGTGSAGKVPVGPRRGEEGGAT